MASRMSILGALPLLVALPACPGVSSQPPSPDPAPPATAAGLSDAGANANPAGVVSAAPTFEEPVVDRRLFREILVGALPYPGARRTWTFTRGATRARLEAACQLGDKAVISQLGMRLTGIENDPRRWVAPVVTVYDGVQTSRSPLSYRLSAVAGLGDAAKCARLDGVLLFTCHPAQVAVLRAGASLVVGKKGPNDETPPYHWSPPAREPVASLRCEARAEGDAGDVDRVTLWPSVAFVFAAGKSGAPGVEWAFENSDMVVQTGAYRWMPPL